MAEVYRVSQKRVSQKRPAVPESCAKRRAQRGCAPGDAGGVAPKPNGPAPAPLAQSNPLSSPLQGERSRLQREQLILEHLPRVRSIARRIHRRLPKGISIEDLISTGIVGLIAAVDRFDHSLNVKLGTYAEHKIRGAILDGLRGLDWAPRRDRRRAKQIEAAVASAEQRLQRTPDPEDIAESLGLDLKEYYRWSAGAPRLCSLGIAETVPESLASALAAPDEAACPSCRFERREQTALLAQAIQKMPRQERIVLYRYYIQEFTLCQISVHLRLSQARVFKIRSQGLMRLRSYWTAQTNRDIAGGSGLSRFRLRESF